MQPMTRWWPSVATCLSLAALFVALGGTSYGKHTRDASPVALVTPARAAFSTFKDSFQLSTNANQFVTVARLNVPAGRYAIVAKLFVGPPANGLNDAVRCDLVAGQDFDRVVANHDAEIGFASLSLNVAH